MNFRKFIAFLDSYKKGIKAGNFHEEPVGDDLGDPF